MVAKTQRGKHNEQEVINAYICVQRKYGKIFYDLTKERIYREVSEITDHSTSRISKIVREFIKGKLKLERD